MATIKPSYTAEQIITQLTTSWGGGNTKQRLWGSALTPGVAKADITFGVNTANPTNFTEFGYPLSSEGSGLVSMTALQVSTAVLSFHLWDDLIFTSLTESGGADANITLNYSSATIVSNAVSGTYSSPLTYGTTPDAIAADQIWLASSWASNGDAYMVNGGYGFLTMLHEIGHSLGLSHPGPYDASTGTPTFDANAVFAQDNRQNTVMSYFGGYDNTAKAWTQDGARLSYEYPQTPMVYDIAAIQSLYGADTGTRIGDTVYGYNCNLVANDTEKPIFDFLGNAVPVFSIWDAGGDHDALDCSGWAGNQLIDLMPGAYSSVRGLNNNIGIAFGTTIEDAIGGSGNDVLTGNDAANMLNGGAAADTMSGGLGNDSYYVDDSGDVVTETSTPATEIDSVYSSVAYALTANVENLTLTGEAAVNATGNAQNNVLAGNTSANILDGGAGDDTIAGGGGSDVFFYAANGNGADSITDFSLNDTIRVAGADFSGAVFAGDGSTAGLNQVQVGSEAGITTLSIGTDLFQGADIRIQLAGSFYAGQFQAKLTDIGFNNAPVPTGIAAILTPGTEDTAYIVSAAQLLSGWSDAGGDTLSVSGLTADHGAVADNGDGTYTVTPAADYNGAMQLSYDVYNGLSSTAAMLSYSVAAVNDAPALTGAAAILAAGTEDIGYSVSATQLLSGWSDADGNALSVTGLAADHGGVADNGDGTYTVTPVVDYNGVMRLSYGVYDGLASTAAVLNYAVIAVNDAPAPTGVAAILAAGTEDIAYSVSATQLLGAWSDADGNALSLTGLTADHGVVADNGNGIYSIIPAANYNGVMQLSYGVYDGSASTAATLNYAVAAVNDAPVAGNRSVVINEDATKVFTISDFGFRDIDAGNTLQSVSINRLATAGQLKLNNIGVILNQVISSADINAGRLTFTPAANANGAGYAGFGFKVGDGGLFSASAYTMTVNVTAVRDDLSLIGTAGNDTLSGDLIDAGSYDVIFGQGGDDNLSGLGGNDSLDGSAGNDTLNGGKGADVLTGGDGSDSYYVDNAGDAVIETDSATGVDAVNSYLGAYRLGANVENGNILNTSAAGLTGNSLNNSLSGNAGNNILSAGAGDDTLNGGKGADRLIGGDGSDTYYVDNAGDAVVETNVNASSGGVDTVNSYIYAYTLGPHVENGTIQVAITAALTGNNLSNILVGNSGRNSLNGGAGNDTLTGGAGADSFVFNTSLNAATNNDLITDFNTADDAILLENGIMAGLGLAAGRLPAAEFRSGIVNVAAEADDRIIYNTSTGALYYDADGAGGRAAVHIATIGVFSHAPLSSADFVVI